MAYDRFFDGAFPFHTWGSDDLQVDGAFPAGEGMKSRIISAVAVAINKVRVIFDQEMKQSNASEIDDALHVANYVFTSLSGVPRTSQSVSVFQVSPTAIDVTLDGEMTNGVTYTVTVSDVINLYGLGLNTNFDSYDFTGLGTAPRVSSATTINTSSFYVDFNEAMDTTGITTPGNYQIAGPVYAPLVASLVEIISTVRVKVTFTGEAHTSLADNYTVTVNTAIRDIAWNSLDSGYRVATFRGIGVPPRVESAVQIDLNKIRLTFNEGMNEDADLIDINNYRFSGNSELITSNVLRIDSTNVDISFTGKTILDNIYTITVNGFWGWSGSVKDLVRNDLDEAHNSATFLGYGERPRVSSAYASDSFNIRVYFNKDMDATVEIVTPSRYTVLGGTTQIHTFDVRIVDPRTVELHVLGVLQDATTYTVAVGPPYDGITNDSVELDPDYHTATFITDFDLIIIWVATTGNDVVGDGSQHHPYLTIERALVDFTNGDQIRILDGVYTPTDTVMITGLEGSIFAENADAVTIQPQSATKFGAAIAIKSSTRFTIQGVNIIQSDSDTGHIIGIYAEDVENFIAHTCSVADFNCAAGDVTGICAQGDGRIIHCRIEDFSVDNGAACGIRSGGLKVIDCAARRIRSYNGTAIGIDLNGEV
jgi:hypothetical protein